jgi:hypothetical protein
MTDVVSDGLEEIIGRAMRSTVPFFGAVGTAEETR